ncbi:MAG: glycoside hydrolase family 2 protein, partial [Clostridia bacterium]|nr:glycoside hydrolase family 2 protein [Clostridia bacterium]
MRDFIKFNDGWLFSKSAESIPSTLPTDWEQINLPHTWNATDGQDGGNDYHRGTCYYAKAISKADLPQADLIYLEIRGANSSADVYLNGKKIKSHDGGYSTWHADMTDNLSDTNLLVIAVDNSPNDRVYPQMADFTFYGGLYRDVNIIGVSESHFEFTWGSNGLLVTPKVDGNNATVEIKVQLENQTDRQSLVYTVNDAEGNTVASVTVLSSETKAELNIDNVHLWNGRKDPYLYTAKVELIEGDTVLDEVSARFGCRTFKVDPEKGFFLNGESYPLRGVSRHQDRLGIGNALLPEHHEEDIELICEVGANTIRLAHYQHDQYFYDLCDEKGLVIWAEIPYISKHLPNGRENTISQMHELVFQTYNHASIFFWGLSNEITMGGAEDSDLIENHRILNDLVHDIDRTRLTTMAVVSMCDIHASYIKIPDLVSYNHYFGWYGGDTSMNGPWFDKFHKEFPNIPIGMSEY